MKIGCSLPFSIFSDEMNEISVKICESFGGRENLLETMAKEIDSIELRAVRIGDSAESVYTAVSMCKKYGLGVTIHGDVRGAKSAADFFASYIKLFDSGFQDFYNITVHTLPTKVESESMLKEICTLAENENYPVRITLENERLKNENSINGICISVEEIVNRVNSPILFSCFDFGHQLSNIRKFGED